MNFKKNTCFLVMVFLLPPTVSSVSAGDNSSEAEELQTIKGAEILNNNCSRCHNARAINEFSVSEWSVVMPHMRTRAHLTASEVASVMQFIQSISEASEKAIATTNGASAGEALINAYACLGCHSLEGKGGTVAIELDNVVSRLGEDFFREKVSDPQFNNAVTPMPDMDVSRAEIEMMIEYLQNL